MHLLYVVRCLSGTQCVVPIFVKAILFQLMFIDVHSHVVYYECESSIVCLMCLYILFFLCSPLPRHTVSLVV